MNMRFSVCPCFMRLLSSPLWGGSGPLGNGCYLGLYCPDNPMDGRLQTRCEGLIQLKVYRAIVASLCHS